MASDEQHKFERDTVQRLLELQARVVGAPLTLPAKPTDLHEQVRRVLTHAARAELLKTGMHSISRLLGEIKDSTNKGVTVYAFSCGPIDFKRGPADATSSLVRCDGATLSFSITLGQSQGSPNLELIAYRFDLTLPTDSLLRFDLDPPDKGHSGEGLRAHIHAGNEDLRLPSAVFHPLEALRFLLLHPRVS